MKYIGLLPSIVLIANIALAESFDSSIAEIERASVGNTAALEFFDAQDDLLHFEELGIQPAYIGSNTSFYAPLNTIHVHQNNLGKQELDSGVGIEEYINNDQLTPDNVRQYKQQNYLWLKAAWAIGMSFLDSGVGKTRNADEFDPEKPIYTIGALNRAVLTSGGSPQDNLRATGSYNLTMTAFADLNR